MSQETQTTPTTLPSPVELALHYTQFDLLPELQRLFPDIILTCVTDHGNTYRVSFSRNGEGGDNAASYTIMRLCLWNGSANVKTS